MTTDINVRIDRRQVERIASRLARVRARAEYFVPSFDERVTREQAIDFWFFVIGICQATRTARGVVEGRDVRGSDYLILRAHQRVVDDPSCFSAGAVRRWTEDELRAFFSDDGDPRACTLDRIEERLRMLHEMAAWLHDAGCEHLAEVFGERRWSVAGGGGVEQRLTAVEAYSDPARKKTWLLLIFLQRLDLVSLTDPERVGLPVDYHIARVMLRSGAVVVEDLRLWRALNRGTPITAEQDVALRRVISRAGTECARAAGIDLFALDNLLWMIGRNCCFYEHPPVCRAPKPCAHRDGCSLIASTDYACDDRCPLEGTCRASRDGEWAALREPEIETHFY